MRALLPLLLLLGVVTHAAPAWEDTLRGDRARLVSDRVDNATWDAFWRGHRTASPAVQAERLSATLQAQTGALPLPRSATELHVGPAAQFSTLHAAQDAARKLDEPVRIVVHAGRYQFDQPLLLGPEDAGTHYEAAGGEDAVLTAGRHITTPWRTDNGRVWYTDIPEAANGAWPFRNLFVDGRREQIARFPNACPDTNDERGWLRVNGGSENQILAGLQQTGDWLSYRVTIAEGRPYALWVSYATTMPNVWEFFHFSVDGNEQAPTELPVSGSWRTVAKQRLGAFVLTAGEHTLRIAHSGPKGTMNRLHLDWFLFTPELSDSTDVVFSRDALRQSKHVLVQAEDNDRSGGESSMGFQTFPVDRKQAPKPPRNRFPLATSTVKEAWGTAPQAEVWCWVSWGWYNSVTRIAGVEHNVAYTEDTLFPRFGDVIHVKGLEAASPIWSGNRLYVFNILEELDAPGEWFLDYQSGRLSYIPHAGRDPNGSDVTAPGLDRLIEIRADAEAGERVENIALRGFIFEHTDRTREHAGWRTSPDAAVHLVNTWHCTVDDCEFRDLGGYGIRLFQDSCLNRISNNHIHDTEAGGVILTGPIAGRRGRFPGIPADSAVNLYAPVLNLVSGNHVHHIGLHKKYVAGVHADPRPRCTAQAPGNVIRGNTIHDVPRNGVFVFSNCGGTVIECNRIERCLLESDDGGPIHLCATHAHTAPGIIRTNLLRHAPAFRQGNTDHIRGIGNGVYLDDFTSNMLIRDNVIVDMATAGIFYHHGLNNASINNIIVNGGRQQFWFTKNWDGNSFLRNIVAWDRPSDLFIRYAYMLRDPAAADASHFDYNVLWNQGEMRINSIPLADWRRQGFETHTLVTDPLFLDPRHPERGLLPESPALDLGFTPITPQWPQPCACELRPLPSPPPEG